MISSKSEQDYTSPENLINEISRVNNQFDGQSQQDCHEFLSEFLDILHSNLNRPLAIDNCSLNCSQRVSEWQIWKAQNNSIIGDSFYGQVETILTCK